MDRISDEDVQLVKATLSAMLPTLVLIVRSAWRQWEQNFLRLLPGCPVRARRNILWALILQQVRLRLGDSSGVALRETQQGHFLVIIRGANRLGPIILRFKYLRPDFTTSNYPTQGAIKYGLQLPLPGIPRGTRLTIGYALNPAETEIEGIFWVWSVGTRVLWRESLIEQDDRTVSLPLPELRPAAARRVTPKAKKKESDSGS
jgi:hypothetical protein